MARGQPGVCGQSGQLVPAAIWGREVRPEVERLPARGAKRSARRCWRLRSQARNCCPATLPIVVAVLSVGRFGFLGQGQPLLLGVVELRLGGGELGTDPSQFFVVCGRSECLCQEVSLSG
jgi:hypothetical protein